MPFLPLPGKRRAVMVLLVLVILAPGCGRPAGTDRSWDPHPWIEKALAARQAKNYGVFRENMEAAVRIAPGHPDFMYYLALADALAGDAPEALAWLGGVAETGLVYPAAEEPAFAPLKESAEFRRILGRFEANALPVHQSSVAFSVPEKAFIAEGLAYDPRQGVFFVGSVRRRKIVSVGRDGTVRDFSRPEDALWGAFGMKVDARRQVLWVASSAVPEMEGYRAEDDGRAGIFKYDLGTGKLLGKYLPPEEGGKHLFGDLTVSPGGDVFVTDSVAPCLYRIEHHRDRLEPFIESGPFVSLQGIDVSGDGKRLYVADYSRGIFLVELPGRKPVLLARPDSVVLLGIDGLYLRRGFLLAIQNGTRPNRVVRLFLGRGGKAVRTLEVLEAGAPGLDGPTLGTLAGEEFYYIANSEWDAFGPVAAGAVAARLREPVVFKVPL